METYTKRIMECCERVITVGKSPDVTFTPAETELFTAVQTNWTTMKALVVDQIGGKLEFGRNSTVSIPRDVIHQVVNSGNEPLHLIAAFGQSPVDIYLPDGDRLTL